MKKRILFVLILTFLSSACFADEYVLVMSKDDCVCQHMLKIYNEDLREYGEIKYDQHEEFKAIKWEEKTSYTTYQAGKKRYFSTGPDTVLVSRFDINNDGTEEIVVKSESSFKGILSDGLYYFTGESADYFKDGEFDVSLLRKATGSIGGGPAHVYDLKELPQFLYLGIGDKEAKAYYSLGGYVYIHPFFFKGCYYLDIKDEVPYDIDKIYSSNFLELVAKPHKRFMMIMIQASWKKASYMQT
jgi:hypothetical protein